jgi:crotonobetainyl-CoA:carnitine CoA-transferase CaiB-like acyl-CoA transferase
MNDPTAAPVLSGIKVVDFTHWMAGPHASLVLGDFGADVVKVEPLPGGDPSRCGGSQYVAGVSQSFLSWNRNKRSIALDLRSESGRTIAHALIRNADVLIENFRPGVTDRIGIDAASCAALNPQLVYCSVSAYGGAGPLGAMPGIDPMMQAFSGLMSITGESDRGPVFAGMAITDYAAALTAVQAVLLALIARAGIGRGQRANVTLIGATLAGMATRLENAVITGTDPVRAGGQSRNVYPNEAFATKDGHVVAGISSDHQWPGFCAAVGLPTLADDPRYKSSRDRLERREELAGLLRDAFARQPTSDLAERFATHGILFAPVNTFTQVAAHPQVQAMGLVDRIDHPTVGSIPQVAPSITLSETPARITRHPPLLGEHTKEVLAELGYTEAMIDVLYADRVVA